jgi:hypothetical protein
MAFRNRDLFYKEFRDIAGEQSRGWETMHVPARFRVEDARIGLENWPAISNPIPLSGPSWRAAVGYLTSDPNLYRIAYYMTRQN